MGLSTDRGMVVNINHLKHKTRDSLKENTPTHQTISNLFVYLFVEIIFQLPNDVYIIPRTLFHSYVTEVTVKNKRWKI